jgi:hypothetical protein
METRIVRYRDGQASYVMVHPNATGTWELDKRLRNPARIRLPQQGHVYDVRGGKYLGAVQEVDRTLTEGEPDIFGVMPYRVTGVTCAVDRPSFTVGDAVTCGVKVAASAPAGRHVVLVRVSGPDGKERPAYTAKVEAPQGVGSARFVLALNDPAGTWKVVARDTVSGLEATADFTVAQRLAAP